MIWRCLSLMFEMYIRYFHLKTDIHTYTLMLFGILYIADGVILHGEWE